MPARTIRINGVEVPVIDDQLAGRHPHRDGTPPHSDRSRLVAGERLARPAVAVQTPSGNAPPPAAVPTYRHDRINHETGRLARIYPGIILGTDASFIYIPDFPIPTQRQPVTAALLVVPPPNYPESAPDGFYLDGNAYPGAGTPQGEPGRYYGSADLYSELGYRWHPLRNVAYSWDPSQDSLATFVQIIRTYLATVG